MKAKLLIASVISLLCAGCGLIWNTVGYGTDERPYAINELDGDSEWEPLQEVVPPATADGGVVTVHAVDHTMLGIEGYVVLARLEAEDGTVVLDARIADEGRRVTVLPGRYAFTGYYRSCDGNCGYLDPPETLCSADVTVQQGTESVVTISVASQACAVD